MAEAGTGAGDTMGVMTGGLAARHPGEIIMEADLGGQEEEVVTEASEADP